MKLEAAAASIRFVQDKLKDIYYTIEAWEGYEEFGRAYEHVVVIACEKGNLKLEDFFLQPATIELDCFKSKDELVTRLIKGIIRKVSVDADESNQFLYTFYVVPKLWQLSQKDNTRIFQKVSSKEMVQQIVGDYGIPMEMQLKATPRTREYCVQYQETDLNFISRLAEDDGYYFYFKQEEDKVIFIDDPSFIKDCVPLKEFAWDPGEGMVQVHPETIRGFEDQQQPRWTQAQVKDYNYRTPDEELLKPATAGTGYGQSYLYLTGHTTGGEGETIARLRLEEQRSGLEVLTIASSVRSVAVGYKFKLLDFPSDAYTNKEYQVTRLEHHFQGKHYRNSFVCVPALTPYRPPRITRRPFIAGLQSATVVGPSGYTAQGNSAQDIYVDDMGRIKVLFKWDLDKSRNEESSCWVRLMREYAGPNYGIFFIPRVGNEVLVAFMEGNPDLPVVAGSIHHANNMPPLKLPANKTQNTLLMPSANELRFEDKEGQEQIYQHAQKDNIRIVENNETISVKANRSKSVGGDETSTITGNRTETVKKDETITIQGNRTETVTKDEAVTIDGKHTSQIKKDTKITVTEGNYDFGVEAGTGKFHVKGAVTEDYDANQKTTVANEIEITSKSAFVHLKASSEIKLEVGASSILMKSDGSISIKGMNIAVEGSQSVNIHGASVTSKADADHNIKGAIVVSEATAANTVKGGMVMLNP